MKIIKLLSILIFILCSSLRISASNFKRYEKLVYSFEGDCYEKKMSIKDKQRFRLLLDKMKPQGVEYDEKRNTIIIICEWITESTSPIRIYYKSSKANNIPFDIESKYYLLLNDDREAFNRYYISASKTFEAYDTVYKIIYTDGKISNTSFMASIYSFRDDT